MDQSEGFMVDDTAQDDGIIELTQVVGKNASDTSDLEVIELTDIDSDGDGGKLGGLELDFDTFDKMEAVPEDLPEPEMAPASLFDAESAITQEQVDAALERVIEKKFGKKIEKLLFEVLEKVLERELVDIRMRLEKDIDKLSIS